MEADGKLATPSPACRVGVDVGGTFTDFVLARGVDVFVRKVPSTPPDFDRAILATLSDWCRELGIDPGEITELVHGTTASENIVLQGKGARVGLLTTEGFEDVLEIARGRNPNPHDLRRRRRAPLAERRFRLGVRERLDARGSVLIPLDPASAEAAIARLSELGVEAVAICLLHSYRNPLHEQELARMVHARMPDVPISVSSELSGRLGEYERTNTTVVDAYVKPEMNAYVERLAAGLRARGFTAPLLIVQANGAMMPAAAAMLRPLLTIGSGPAAGVAGAAWVARETSIKNVLAFDLGGTTAKASALADLRIPHQSEYEIGSEATGSLRITRGGDGYLVRLPAIEVSEVGAGGGSIARLDEGVLKVGPRSAGAVPGPVCYAKGGTEPTVTDANAVLGYFSPHGLLSGGLPLDIEGARRVIKEHLADPMGVSVEEAAFGIVEIANAEMVRALAAVTYNVGLDAQQFTMLAYGGGGAVHALALAREMGIRTVLVPLRAGLFSSVGMLVSPMEYEQVNSILLATKALDLGWLNGLLDETDRSLTEIATAGSPAFAPSPSTLEVRHTAELQYRGESGTLEIELSAPVTEASLEAMRERFTEDHQRRFGFTTEDEIDVVNLRTVLRVRSAEGRDIRLDAYLASGADAHSGTSRRAYFGPGIGWVDTNVFARADLRGATIEGPAIVEEHDTTVVIPPGCSATLDARSNIEVTVASEVPGGATWSRDPDAVRVEKLRLAIEAAAERGTAAIRMTARSALARETETSASIALVGGDLVGGHGGDSLGRIFMLEVLERFKGSFAPGDVYASNDPYIGSGHLPHIDAARPVFLGGELIGFGMVSGHQVDMGGIAAGSMSPAATDTFQEGLFIPLMRLCRRDEPNPTLLSIIEHNVRAPQTVLGDINGLIASLKQIEQEMIAIARRFGTAAAYRQAMETLLGASEASARSALRAIPDGVGEWVEKVDYAVDVAEPLVINVRIEKSGDSLTIDFTGTSPQAPRAINSTWSPTSRISSSAVMPIIVGGNLPSNTGVLRSVRVIAPPGCLLNPRRPAACGARAVVVLPMTAALIGALSSIVPDRVTADTPKQEAAVNFSGRAADGRPFVYMEQLLGSGGGSAFQDGSDTFGSMTTRNGNVPVEQIENEMPLRIERYRFAEDSGGPGRHRGGLAIERAFRVVVDDVTLQLRSTRERTVPWGLFGGEPGTPTVRYIERSSGERVDVGAHGKFTLNAGDLLVYRTCGSGGFGPVGERGREAVWADLESGKITREHAAAVYGLATRPA